MKIESKKNGTTLTITMEGRLDTVTTPDLEMELKSQLEGVTELILDFGGVGFISSAGLRTILWAQKQIPDKNGVTLKNVNENVREVFELTGLNDILNIE